MSNQSSIVDAFTHQVKAIASSAVAVVVSCSRSYDGA